jgi:DNA-binding transcriptional ArsR family regulator
MPTNADRVLNALGSPTRRQIVRLLGADALSVGELAARLPVSRPGVSKQLRVLEKAGLVEYRSEGTRNIFRLRQEGFDEVRQWLDGFWDDALVRFAMVAENLPEEEL